MAEVERLLRATGALTGAPANDLPGKDLPGKDLPVVDPALAKLAQSEGLAALLGARLRAGRLRTSNPEVDRQLRQSHRQASVFYLLLEARLRPILDALARQGVPVLALKGVALVERVYGDPGSRPMGDADLLVPAAHWPQALEAIRQAGGKIGWSPGRPLTARRFHEVHIDAGRVVIDLHRQVHDPRLFAVDHEGLFGRAIASADQPGLRLPETTDLLLTLGTHAAQDGFLTPLRAVVDCLLLIQAGGVDPAAVVGRARSWRARRATALWLRTLLRLGLDHAALEQAAEELDPGGRLTAAASQLPHRPPLSGWRQKWHLARSLDSLQRPLLLLLDRGFWRLADATTSWRQRHG